MAKEVPLITNSVSGTQRKRTFRPITSLGPISLRVLTIASAASLLLFYLAQTTQSATKSYEVQALSANRDELVQEVDRLELEAQRLQSLGAITEGLGDTMKDYQEAGELKTVSADVIPE